MPAPTIRPATEADLPRLVEVEAAAGQRFHSVGMPAIADDVPEIDELRESLAAGRLWLVEVGSEAAGYVTADVVDGNAYVGQVSVDPAYAGRGLGRVLMELVEEWGRAAGCPATTLTTFRDVPWNAPYYRRLGYEVLTADRIGPELVGVMELQAALPLLGTAPRCAMGKPNGPRGEMLAYGSRAQKLPAPPHVVWESLADPHQERARPWLELLDDEVEPTVVEQRHPVLVVWSSLWTSRPNDLVRLDVEELPSGETRLRFTLLTPDQLPSQSRTGHIRKRINQLLFGELRFSYGQ